ncbi:TPA: flavodoxin family protein [Streptococcus suis]|uniref:flavodoxin family protein n=1 Tax=Streptococcus suis TaxID=1307 RepID=UPI0006967A34|nr:flavodoxin family protein [Streptococcus suis]NQR01216.1 flavodoxin family protein [Streptococcus suis]NQR72771.1 flavodoxin family protein [Streptococcus suis]NQS32911.1 flavodoxin family protein [Streptococcus suis]CYX26513.1 NADPH-dependent FMN reductase [Streptococcus suis]HEM5621388.1 flavodoxin family protein [Streptococcus suis]
MKKVFFFIPLRKEKSRVWNSINNIIRIIREKTEVEIILRTSINSKIKTCIGCERCFTNGKCTLDKYTDDDMFVIKKEMLESDIIVWISPVYLHNLNADMKNFLDRIAYWTHMMRLVGKQGIAISYSDTNGEEYVYDYLNKIINYMGIRYGEGGAIPLGYLSDVEMEKENTRIANMLIDMVDDDENFKYKQNQRMLFDLYLKSYLKSSVDNSESKFWKNINNLGINSLESFETNMKERNSSYNEENCD